MGVFHTQKVLYGNASLIPVIAEQIKQEFESQEYEVHKDSLLSGGADISITKGGTFKAVLGMRTALKITLIPQDEGISFDASVGIYGQQAIPTIISMFFFWPVLITQIWGLVKQSKLDDQALEIAERIIHSHKTNAESSANAAVKYCIHCGKAVPENAAFCQYCGSKL